MIIGLNARFLCAPLTGVQRFGHEMMRELPAHANVILLAPAGAPRPAGFAGDIIRGNTHGHLWEQAELVGMAHRAGCDVVLHPANTLPLQHHRSVVTVHDPLVPISNPEWFTPRYVFWQKHLMSRAIRRATQILTVSEWSRVHLARMLHLPASRVHVTPQGLAPFDVPADGPAVTTVKRRYHLQGQYLLAFGGRDPRKNIRFLAQVLEVLRRRGVALNLVVVGDAHPRVHRLDLRVVERADLRLLGHVSSEDTHALLTGASVLCFPSFCESFGRPPLEALACGTPALVGPYDAAHEVLGDDRCILPLDAERWAAAIVEEIDDPLSGARALARAQPLRARYNWPATAQSVLAACDRAASRTSQTA